MHGPTARELELKARYELPRREEMEAELAGAKVCSKLDADCGFHQIPLDDATSKICTFSTPFGRYRFLRLPFEISSAPEAFQKTMSRVFDELEGTRVYIDDVLIWGASQQEHDKRLRAALRAAKTAGLTLNLGKCVFGVESIWFLRDIISNEGIKPAENLIKCIIDLPAPTCKQELQRLLGAVNYFGKYMPNL